MYRRNLCLIAMTSLALGGLSPASASAPASAGGEALFAQDCARCHSATTAPGVGPGLGGLFKRKTLPSGRRTTEANVRSQILAGGGGMPPFRDALSAAQVDALIAYLRTL
jgi:mono/diheme cytochrome c family protein